MAKYWTDGEACCLISGDGSQKYWLDGLPFEDLGNLLLALTEDISDNLDNWNDTLDESLPGIAVACDDTLELSEEIALFKVWLLPIEDDANNWNDATGETYGYSLSDGDSLSNWLDSLYYVYDIWWVNLTVAVADDIGAKGPGNRNKYGWKDAIQYQFEAADIIGLFISIDDLEAQFEDAVDILLAQWIGAETVAIGDQMWDSMMYGLADDMEVRAIVPRSFSDNMVLGDFVSLNMPSVGLPNDSLSLSDVISLILNIGLSEGDDIANMDDTAGSNFPDITSKTASDTFSMSDAILTPILNTPATSYLRRYLNDVKD